MLLVGNMCRTAPDIRIEFRRVESVSAASDMKRLLMATLWQRAWSEEQAEAIFQWRYCELPIGETVIAYDGVRPVAAVASCLRTYRIGQELVKVREPADWFCLPEYRCFGVGVKVMLTLIDQGDPLLAIGGPPQANRVFPALGGHRLPDARTYLLPLTARALISKTRRVLHLSNNASKSPEESASRRREKQDRQLNPADLPPPKAWSGSAYAFAPFVREDELAWLYAAPEKIGTFFSLAFEESNADKAFVLGRFYTYQGLRYAKLIHLYTSSPSVKGYARLLDEAMRYVSDREIDIVQCRATSPWLRRALKKSGFLWSSPEPVYWFANDRHPPEGNFHMSFLRGDDGILPYPE